MDILVGMYSGCLQDTKLGDQKILTPNAVLSTVLNSICHVGTCNSMKKPEQKWNLTGKADVESVGETKIHRQLAFEDKVKNLRVLVQSMSSDF